MRANTTKQKLREGGCVFGVFLGIPSPRLVELCGASGFDYVVIDAEHGPIDVAVCEDMVRAAEACGITPLVRVPENHDKTILRYLDIGAQGVMVPQVNSRADAERALRAIKYAPLGHRGLAAVRAASYGQGISLSEYTRRANDETMFLPQIENISALDHLDEILQLDGIDVIELGTADLSQSMGHPGETGHPDVQAAVDEITKRALAAGKVVGDTINDPTAAAEAVRRGVRKLDCSLIGVTVRALSGYSRTVREAAKAGTR
jgi:4-hydroxy-2-oxoheptanedioate aldolase